MDNSIEAAVSRLEKDLVAMKSPQPVGSNSIRAYETLTNYIWDYDYTMTANNWNGISYTHGFSIIFTARNQSAPFGDLRFMATVNGERYNPLTAANNNGGPTQNASRTYIRMFEDIFNTGSLGDYAKDNTLRWRFTTSSAQIGTVVRIKVIVSATDLGRIDIRLNNTF